MKKHYFLFILVCFGIYFLSSAQQITTDSSPTLEALIQDNLGQGCVEISNISSSVNGSVNSIPSFGFFERANSNFPFQNGIMLSTGNVNSAGNAFNTNLLHEGDENWGTDTDLESALNINQTLNATSIEFDFISVASQIQFNYLLASEEYVEDFPCNFSDGFAFLIREAGTNDPFINIAVIPGTSIPVNTNTIHDAIVGSCPAENEAFFEGNNIGDTNYNGRTVVLTATASILPNVQYQIKLIIADQGDQNYDSAVFIEGNSFDAVVDLGPDITSCGLSTILNADIQNPFATYEWFKDNVLIAGENSTTLNVTESGTYNVEISIQLNNTFCLIEDEILVTLDTEQAASNISDFLLCDDASNDGIETFDLNQKNNEVLSTVPGSNYNISYHLSADDAQNNLNPITNPIQNTSSPQAIFVRIEDIDNGCLAFSTFNLVVNQVPEINDPAPFDVCDDEVSDGFTFINLTDANDEITGGNPNLFVSYHFSQPDADAGINQIFSPYLNINPINQLFVRVIDATTGCVSTTTITVTVKSNPDVNIDNQSINACEQDSDGFETFDLTSIIGGVLQGLTGVTLTFHETFNDAQSGSNPIADTTNYQNIVPNFQFIYIRVEDEVTGCFTVTLLELHTNIIETGFNTDAFEVCDDASNDGIEEFNLANIENELLNGNSGYTVIFYETEQDQIDDVNPINEATPYVVNASPQQIYATIIADICTEFITITLVINPSVDIAAISVEYCDTNDDGFASIFLETFNNQVSAGVSPFNVKYYLTEIDAEANENILPPFYNNVTNPDTIWVRVTNPQTGCYDVEPLEIIVVSAPTILQPTNIIICDDDQDAISTVNLEDKIPEIIPNPAGLDVTFYTTYNDAYTDTNSIVDADNYDTATQTIYARVESSTTGCFSIASFFIYVNTLPEFIPISIFENCEADISNVADFFFYLKDAEILNGQTGKQVLYFETENDAINRTNIINKFAVYQNTSSPQTIYVRVENITDENCFGTSSFGLEVGSLPIFNAPIDILICDDITNDGFETVDLIEKVDEMSLGVPLPLTITFYLSLFDADNAINQIPTTYTNTVNPQQIFARIENGTFCHAIATFTINVIQVPLVNPASAIIVCDDDYDGIQTFDLTISEIEILGVRQDNIEVTYFETVDDLEANINPILNPDSYNNISNPQTVYVKINNTVSNCFVIITLELIVNLPPVINDFQTVEICDNENHTFNFNTIETIVVDDVTDIIFSYHLTQNDAINNTNLLSTNYTFTASNTTIFIRLEFGSTGCFTTYTFDLIVHPLPIANIPPTLEACDDDSNDTFAEFNLASQTTTVLGNQNSTDFTVTYHINETQSNDGSNPLSDIYTAQNGQIIYVRIENNTTGCYSLTLFDVIVNPHPEIPQPLILCDADYDGNVIFDLTVSETDLFTIDNPDNIISYFESMDDLNADTNPIVNPTIYTNLSNPQTIFIKVYNTVANCFTFVPLELNVNLPPAINTFAVFETCDNETSSFDLTEISAVIVDDNTNVLFSYYTNLVDATNSANALNTNYTYLTVNDIIFARVEFSTTQCFIIYPFELQVNPLPIANIPPTLEACDDDSNNNIEEFNLESQTATVLGNQSATEFTVTYHINENSANNGTNLLGEFFTGQNGQTIYVRIENNLTTCYSLTQFDLIVNPHPEIPEPLLECDADYDGNVIFDLTVSEDELFTIDNPDNVISYFESINDLNADANPIVNPINYTNLSNPQTVYIKVFNTVANCFTFVPLELNVNLPPAINPFSEFETCENDTNSFDLSEINDIIVDANFNVLFSYYSSLDDANNQVNTLNINYIYQTTNDIIYARIEFSTTHCFFIYPFELRVNPLPIANQPDNLESCDDDFDGFFEFDLTQQNISILNGQNPNNFTISFYSTEDLANEGLIALENPYQAIDGEIIYVRVENNTTNCFSTTQFTTIINPKPIVDVQDQVICIDNLPLLVSANTNNPNDMYSWSTSETTPEIEITEIGTYSVTVTSIFGCETTSFFSVSESESAIIELTEVIDFADPNNITITISGIGNYLYILDDGEPQESNVFENVSLGFHTITIIDLNGCAEITKDVVVIDAPKFVTPNGDGYFDTWHITGVETLPGTIVYVFDRYGKLLKTLTSTSRGWDGTYNGYQMPASDYWFLAKVRKDDIAFDVTGHFTLRL